MGLIHRGLIVQRPNFINRRRDPAEMKARLDANQLLNLSEPPGARLPPTRIRIKKNSATRLERILNCFFQTFLGPAGPYANCLPTAGADSSPIGHRDSFRAGDDYGVRR